MTVAGNGGTDEREPTPGFWRGRSVVVTGGSGFLGSHVVERLTTLGANRVFVPRKAEYDLTEMADVVRLYEDTQPDLVLHLAAEVGGIGANRKNPGRFFYANLAMGLNLIEQGRIVGLDKFVQVGTICAYPKHTPVPFREETLWDGYPEETNAPYGIAKKALLVQLQAYRQQYGFNGIYLLPVNLYGPRDNFDPESSHVIPASREFLYVDDCARALILAAEFYDGAEPVNLGTGQEITIADLAASIAKVVRFEGPLVYDPSQPDGQPRRCLDTWRALDAFGFRARVPFAAGLSATVRWFEEESEAVSETGGLISSRSSAG